MSDLPTLFTIAEDIRATREAVEEIRDLLRDMQQGWDVRF